MRNISEIDKNFKIETNIDKADIKFYNARELPFRIYGVFYEDGKFRRLPEAVAKTVSEGVYSLHANTAGGRVRFRTNSSYVAISAKMENVGKMSHFALCGSSGFDLYANGKYVKTYIPPFNIIDGYEGVIELGASEEADITINFPLYSDVCELYIGLEDKATVSEPTPYRIEKPIVYYGSSITQGGCASRPGSSYQSIISRRFDADYINLGFSGNAKGEDEIADYIKNLDMSLFVYDYDFNAPDLAHLVATHERMFLKIREANPELPIVIMSKPKYELTPSDYARREAIIKTYENALARGDKNVYFIPGSQLMELAKLEGTVDSTHPTDLGFYSMAMTLSDMLAKIL
ncbi:MAG: hypothetical protein IJ515_03625 [Clostridia bacterium]|nr:hypothetical protein [Clostridia bacterium]